MSLGDVDGVVVPFLLVHGVHYLSYLVKDGLVVPLPQIQEGVVVQCGCAEVVGAPNSQYSPVVQYECFGDAVSAERSHDGRDVAVCIGVVVTKKPYGQDNAQVVMEEARKEGIGFVVTDGLLLGPVCVVFG